MNSDAKVRFISTSTIQPTSKTQVNPIERIELTPWDLRMLSIQYIQKGLLFTTPPKKEEDFTNTIKHLKFSLSQTLSFFFPLAGRLGFEKHEEDTNDTISVFIDCNSAGAEFIHAAIDVSISDILNPTYVPSSIIQQFFSPVKELTNYAGRFQPLLSVQVTELTDGVFIGCSINHVVCDGTSFWHFFNSWSEISRTSSNNISSPPILKHWFLDNTCYPVRLPLSDLDERFVEKYRYICPPLEERIFHFTRENILRLKEKANFENDTNGVVISSLQSLLAHIWIAITRARNLDPNEETSYRLAMGHRARLNPPLPNTYFGNSIFAAGPSCKAGELLQGGIGYGALLLNQVVKTWNNGNVRSFLQSWLEKPSFVSFNEFGSNPSLVTGSSPWFDMYGNDFGWGRPIGVRSGVANKHNGTVMVFPGSIEGSIDVEVSLSFGTLKTMEDDDEFMEMVTVLPSFQMV